MDFALEHIGLAARNTVALKDWYVNALGARQVFETAETPPAFFLALPGGAMIEIYPSNFSFNGTNDNQLNGWRHLALRVPSIEQARAELEAHGVKFTAPVKPAGGAGRVQFFADREGNLLHLVERPVDTIFTRQ